VVLTHAAVRREGDGLHFTAAAVLRAGGGVDRSCGAGRDGGSHRGQIVTGRGAVEGDEERPALGANDGRARAGDGRREDRADMTLHLGRGGRGGCAGGNRGDQGAGGGRADFERHELIDVEAGQLAREGNVERTAVLAGDREVADVVHAVEQLRNRVQVRYDLGD